MSAALEVALLHGLRITPDKRLRLTAVVRPNQWGWPLEHAGGSPRRLGFPWKMTRMPAIPPLFKWPVWKLLGAPGHAWLVCFGLLPGVVPTAGASGPIAAAAAADSTSPFVLLTLERDCFGCPTGQRLQLRGDGLAVFTELGKARLGTQDRSLQAQLPPDELQQLARVLDTEGIKTLQPEYQLADVQDGAWATLEVVYRAGGEGGPEQTYSVFAREEAAPPPLQRIWAAIEALRLRAGLR